MSHTSLAMKIMLELGKVVMSKGSVITLLGVVFFFLNVKNL